MKLIKKLLYLIVILVILIILVFGYLGFVPGVSNLMGSNKPRDLGVATSSADLKSVENKLQLNYVEGSFKVSGSKTLSTTFTDKELTALINNHFSRWSAYPVSAAQVKFNSDGSAEVSGIIHLDRLRDYAAATGLPADDVSRIANKIQWLNSSPPFYLKGQAEVKNGVLNGGIETLQIGRLSISPSTFGAKDSEVLDFAQNQISHLERHCLHLPRKRMIRSFGHFLLLLGYKNLRVRKN